MIGRAGQAGGRHRVVHFGVILGVLVCSLADAQAASAQRIRGRLVDLVSEEPLEAGALTLRSADSVPLRTVFTDENGNWAFELPGPGVYYIEATRFGYQTWVAGPLEVKQEEDLNSVYRLWPQPFRMDPIEVSVQAARLHLQTAGFYERQRADFGYFLGPEQIEKRRAPRITDLLQGLPGVSMVSMSSGSAGARFVQLRGSSLSQGGTCRPRIFVDGLLYAKGDSRPIDRVEGEETERDEILKFVDQGISLDDIGPTSDIAGIEIYRSATQVPVQFGGTSVSTLCGAIVIWTKRGVRRAPGY
ncbi:MAG: TonB-dependent receptor plug domain-containing protein [Gemmatimonadota bacterium]